MVTPLPLGEKLFSGTSFWNAPLPDHAPLAANSAGLVAALDGELQKEISGNHGPWINTTQYSVPVYTVGPTVPAVRVTLDSYAPQLQADLAAVPIPASAQAAAGSDAQIVIYQPSSDTMWELWVARHAADGWHAAWGGKMTNVSSNPGYFPNPYGATATSLPLVGGLITLNELATGHIDHALAVALPNTAAGAFTWPAQRTDGHDTGVDAIPAGTRFRIDPGLDLTKLGLTPTGLAIARAVQRYGMVVRDTGGCFAFYGEDPGALTSSVWAWLFGGLYPNAVLRNFPWSSLEAVSSSAS